jgi:hypothetical protein
MLEDHKLMYSSGHNKVIYNIEDRSQAFLPGKFQNKFDYFRKGWD